MPKQEPVHEPEPQDPPVVAGTEDVPTEPSTLLRSAKQTYKDSDPLPESKWSPAAEERPYEEAMTDQHREFLAELDRIRV